MLAWDVWPALELGDEPAGLLYAVNRSTRIASRARRRRRGGADPARLRRRLPLTEAPLSLDVAVARGARATRRAPSRRSSARSGTLARTARSTISSTRPTRGWPRTMMAQLARRAEEQHDLTRSRSTTASAGSRSASRSRSPSPPRTAPTRSPPARRRSTPSRGRCRSGRKRSTRAARNGSARADRLSVRPRTATPSATSPPSASEATRADQAPAAASRALLRKLCAPIPSLPGSSRSSSASFTIKFFGIFISVGGYALLWGWRFAVGFVLLIFIHEMGHCIEAQRQGLNPTRPCSSRSSAPTSR